MCGPSHFLKHGWEVCASFACILSICVCTWAKRCSFVFLCVCAIFWKNEEVYTSFTKLKGILLVFGVCLSLKESSHLCVDDFLKWARGLHKLCQARRVFLDFFGLCVNMKAILFLFFCVWHHIVYFSIVMDLWHRDGKFMWVLQGFLYVWQEVYQSSLPIFKKKFFSVCFLGQSLFSFHFFCFFCLHVGGLLCILETWASRV